MVRMPDGWCLYGDLTIASVADGRPERLEVLGDGGHLPRAGQAFR